MVTECFAESVTLSVTLQKIRPVFDASAKRSDENGFLGLL
jgi:hypothetical protein